MSRADEIRARCDNASNNLPNGAATFNYLRDIPYLLDLVDQLGDALEAATPTIKLRHGGYARLPAALKALREFQGRESQ